MINKDELVNGLSSALDFSGAGGAPVVDSPYDFNALLIRFPTDSTLQIVASDGVSLLIVEYSAVHHVAAGTRFVVSIKSAQEVLDLLPDWSGDRVSVMPYQDMLIVSSGADVHQIKRKMQGDFPEPDTLTSLTAPHAGAELQGSRVEDVVHHFKDLTGNPRIEISTRGLDAPTILKSTVVDSDSESLTSVSCYIMPWKQN